MLRPGSLYAADAVRAPWFHQAVGAQKGQAMSLPQQRVIARLLRKWTAHSKVDTLAKMNADLASFLVRHGVRKLTRAQLKAFNEPSWPQLAKAELRRIGRWRIWVEGRRVEDR